MENINKKKCSIFEKLREHRIEGIVILDLVATILGARLVAYYRFKEDKHKNFNKYWLKWFMILLVGGIVVHKLAKVPTMLNYMLGLSEKPEVYKCIN